MEIYKRRIDFTEGRPFLSPVLEEDNVHKDTKGKGAFLKKDKSKEEEE